MSQKVVINKCYGGFGLSHQALLRYAELSGRDLSWELDGISENVARDHGYDIPDDPTNAAAFMLYHYKLDGEDWWGRDLPRDDPLLVQVVEELGEEASGRHARLEVVEIPDAVEWEVEEYDGMEWVAEAHRTWS